MYISYILQTYSTGITKKELTDVEILEQTASLYLKFLLWEPYHWTSEDSLVM